MLKYPQIINMEPFFQNILTLNNLDDRITFAYQYSWKDVWHQCFCMLKWATSMQPWWSTSIAICEKSSSMTPYESMYKLLSKTSHGYIKWICPFFCYSYLKSVHLTCIWMHPLKISVLLYISHNIKVLEPYLSNDFIFVRINNHLRYYYSIYNHHQRWHMSNKVTLTPFYSFFIKKS